MTIKVPQNIIEETDYILDQCFEHSLISHDKFEMSWKDKGKQREPNKDVFKVKVLRHAFLSNFKVAALTFGTPIFRNPVYSEFIDAIIENDAKRGVDPTYKHIVLIFLPRGALKSTLIMGDMPSWDYLKTTIRDKRAPVFYIAHGDMDRVGDNFKRINDNFDKDLVKYLFSDVLQYEVRRQDAIRFKDHSEIKRREHHFLGGSPMTDPTGRHITKGYIDDWVSAKINTKEKQEDNKRAFYRLVSLDDHSGGADLMVPFLMVGTPYGRGSLYTDLRNHPDVLFLEKPVCTRPFMPGEMKADEFNFPEILADKKLTVYKNVMSANQFSSQYDLLEYDLDEGLKFDADLPEYTEPDPATVVATAITADPAISKKNKKSQAVTLVTKITMDGELYVVDSHSITGMSPYEHTSIIFRLARRHNADYAIIENVAYQESLAQEVQRQMRLPENKDIRLSIKRHRHSESKKEHYKAFLEPLLARQMIYINPMIAELIRQVQGDSMLDDYIDCLSFLKELNINSLAFTGKNSNNNKQVEYKKMNRHAVLFQKKKKKAAFEEIGW